MTWALFVSLPEHVRSNPDHEEDAGYGVDAIVGEHGSTALGWMCLQGDKAWGTDLHSKTAAASRGEQGPGQDSVVC